MLLGHLRYVAQSWASGAHILSLCKAIPQSFGMSAHDWPFTMEEENRPADSKSISQAAGTNENHQIPTPPSEEDPAGHGTESIREGSAPGDTGKDVQEQDGEIVVVEEKTASSEDDESEAGM